MLYANDVRRVLVHRIMGHRAALAAAVALGNPAILARQIAETRARLAEVQAITDEVARLERVTVPPLGNGQKHE